MREKVQKVVKSNAVNFLRPYKERKICLELIGLPENIPFDLYLFYRCFHNKKFDSFDHHILKLQHHFDHDFIFEETSISGHLLKTVLLSPHSCSNFLKNMDLDMIPISQTIGLKQIVLLDHKNLFQKGKNGVF